MWTEQYLQIISDSRTLLYFQICLNHRLYYMNIVIIYQVSSVINVQFASITVK